MNIFKAIPACLLVCALGAEDVEGSKDHPLFNRMPGFQISEYETREFDAFKFTVSNETSEDAKTRTIEGRYFQITYTLEDGKPEPSPLQVFRNFENALRKAGATVVAKVVEHNNSYSFITATARKGNADVWVMITSGGTDYQLTIVEQQAMVQVIKASDMLQAIQASGEVALDIHFDTSKATIRAESQPIVDEIAGLLKANPGLSVSIEGHTDAAGTPAQNQKLSEARAKAVLDAVAARGVEAGRLSSRGWGQTKPVADNKTEEGRAKNRRVVVVKR